jgi:hypothetical protein
MWISARSPCRGCGRPRAGGRCTRHAPGEGWNRTPASWRTSIARTVAHEYVEILDQHFDGTGTIFFAIREDGEPDLQEWEREDA